MNEVKHGLNELSEDKRVAMSKSRSGEDVKEFDAVSMILKGIRGTLERLLATSNK